MPGRRDSPGHRASAAIPRHERGIDGTGVAEICEKAGLTHGALYAHFLSKEELTAAALTDGLERSRFRIQKAIGGRNGTLGDYLDAYLSARRRDNPAEGCPIAACASAHFGLGSPGKPSNRPHAILSGRE